MSEEQPRRPASYDVAATVLDRLRARRCTLATAESLTGGLLAAALTDVPGASVSYRGGVVAYATELKSGLLGVPAALLRERGAVDPDVAVGMAEGVRARCAATYGLATTGVAGPDPQDGKPVGLVYVAVAGPHGYEVREHSRPAARSEVRARTVLAALRLLEAMLAADG